MLDVDQNYGTPETPKPLPTFKDCVAQDVQTVFFNLNEFAEERYIDDKGLIPCITQHPGVLERAAHWEGGAKQSFDQGMYKADLLLYVKQKDYCRPERQCVGVGYRPAPDGWRDPDHPAQ